MLDVRQRERENQERAAINKKLDQLIGVHYKTASDFLDHAVHSLNNKDRRNNWIVDAIREFTKAANVVDTSNVIDNDSFIATKSRFYAGVCYGLIEEPSAAMKEYEKAYKKGHEQWEQSCQEIERLRSFSLVRGKSSANEMTNRLGDFYQQFLEPLKKLIENRPPTSDNAASTSSSTVGEFQLLTLKSIPGGKSAIRKLYDSGGNHRRAGRYNEAIDDYSRVLALAGGNHAEALGSRGLVYQAKGQDKEALADFDRALALNSSLDWVKKARNEIQRQDTTDRLVLRNPERLTVIHTLKEHECRVRSLALSVDGQTLVGGDGKSIKIWDTRTGELRQTLKAHGSEVTSVVLSADGQTLVSGSWDKSIKIWDTRTGELRQTLTGGYVESMALSADGQTLVSGHYGGIIKIWDMRTRELRQTLTVGSQYCSVALSADGQTLVGGGNSIIKIWDTRTGELRQTLTPQFGSSVALSADGQTLVSRDDGGSIKIWDTRTGELRQMLTPHPDSRFFLSVAVALSADGQTLVSGSDEDKTIKIWDVETGRCRQTLKEHSDGVRRLALSADGQTLVSGDWQTIKIWGEI
jgi:WD40 repeat protein